ncbi:cyclopropane-fatty-acyl-phospholipid synthase family protein [Phenylobacterium sp.]|uniref:SAM-dependent methyltransferase n=1 Tax=Phenylobacterium sp. TaxID=1871053 RepID=UPI00273242FA|nr:methyltransferase domain-containing protein [Phenylobacterium sp.]MDP3660867.1 hypothetical protein [Phenylobacterium sp.]
MPNEPLLARYPKTRPELPPRFREIYAAQYLDNRQGATTAASAAQRLERWMHIRVAEDVRAVGPAATLEIGAGTLNQLPFEPPGAAYDVVEPFEALYRDAPQRGRIRDVFADIAEVPADRRYARITSIAAFEHVADLPALLARCATLLEEGGALRVAIPSEGGLLWKIGWMATTGLEFRLRHGLDYGILMRHEHLNTAAEIEALIADLFARVEVRALGVGRQLSLYRFIVAREPRPGVAADWSQRFAA